MSKTAKKDTESIYLKCLECGQTFKRRIGPSDREVQCPKCKSVDIDLA